MALCLAMVFITQSCTSSFMARVLDVLNAEVIARTSLYKEVASIVASYVLSSNAFGSQEWKEYFGVVVEDLPIPDEMIHWWFSPDPMHPELSVYATHLPPVLSAQFVDKSSFTLNRFNDYLKSPKKGHPMTCSLAPFVSVQYGNRPGAARLRWLVMRKEVVFRNKPYLEQQNSLNLIGAGYEQSTTLLDVVTVVATHYVVTKERYLSDGTGWENLQYCTFARCVEVLHGGCIPKRLVVGQFSEGVLSIQSDQANHLAHETTGVIALRKFL